uniref:Uncharacterized protein n=1 Tax=Lepeophtheirus salmonis TaxID=72036 RepID=A0A0K2V6Q3_LEPSM
MILVYETRCGPIPFPWLQASKNPLEENLRLFNIENGNSNIIIDDNSIIMIPDQ